MLQFMEPSQVQAQSIRIGTLAQCRHGRSPLVVLCIPIDGQLEAHLPSGAVISKMSVGTEKELFICKSADDARRRQVLTLWNAQCEGRMQARLSGLGGQLQPLATTEAECVNVHIAKVTNPGRISNEHQYQDLRRLQDSPLFGVSEGYKDSAGRVRQIVPQGLTVDLRNYQKQAKGWA